MKTIPKIIFAVMLVILLLMAVTIPQRADGKDVGETITQHVFESKIEGTVNGEAFTAAGSVFINLNSGEFNLEVLFSNIPRGFHPLASSAASWFSIVCGNCPPAPAPTPAPTPKPSPKNICEISLGNFSALVEMTILDEAKVIGEFTQNLTVRRVSEGRFIAESKVDGWYSGPTNLVFSPGYRHVLRQLDRGKIEGVYSQRILTEDGHAITK